MLNALALVNHAYEQCAAAAPALKRANANGKSSANTASPLRSIQVSDADAQLLLGFLQAELQRARALVDIQKRQAALSASAKSGAPPALSETLGDYPLGGAVDLDNIVVYPPRIEAMPIKPIFFDIAWNYIDYPSKTGAAVAAGASKPAAGSDKPAAGGVAPPQQPPAEQQKRGWFGFKR